MSQTTLKLQQIGRTCFCREYGGGECQVWRWAFEHGIAFHEGEPVFNYAAGFTAFLDYLDIRQMTLSLIYGLAPTDDPALANLTLQGIYSPWGQGKGSISAASSEYATAIGATFEIASILEGNYRHQLTIDRSLFATDAVPALSVERLAEAARRFEDAPRFAGYSAGSRRFD